MARNCRDCKTCTMPAIPRWTQWWIIAFANLMTIGIFALVKKGTMKGCPQCGHLVSRHHRRADGSYHD